MATNSNEIYKGDATINDVGIEPATEKQQAKLPSRDHGNAFFIVYDVSTPKGDAWKVRVEISHRELSGRMLEYYRREDGATPTQIDVAIRQLVGQGILQKGATENDIGGAVNGEIVGRKVAIRVTEDDRGDGTYWPPKAYFCSAYSLMRGNDAASRVAAFLAGKPAAKPEPKTDCTRATSIPAPADDAVVDDLPF